MTPKEQAEHVWQAVVKKKFGVKVETDDPAMLHNLLLATRSEAADAELFQFTLQVKGNEVWVVRHSGLPEVKVEGEFEPIETE